MGDELLGWNIHEANEDFNSLLIITDNYDQKHLYIGVGSG
jgi:hypothetical protein